MNRLLQFFLIIILFAASPAFSQTITSTTAGGIWDDATTWIGGVVPTENNDVIIDGNIEMKYNAYCRNLTLNSGKSIQNYQTYYPSLTIKGNLVNYGTIKDHPTSTYMYIYLEGNATNHGSILNRYFYFSGNTGAQTIGGTKGYGPVNMYVYPDNTIHASTDIQIDTTCSVDFYGDKLDMGNHKIKILSRTSDYFKNGTIQTNGEVDITGPFGASISGNFTLTGSGIMELNENTEFIGTATVASGKIIQNLKSWYPSLTIKGDLINYGVLRDNPASTYMYIYLEGNVTNHGSILNRYFYFSGNTGTQTIGGTKGYGPVNMYVNPNNTIHASSNIQIDSTCSVDFYEDILDMGNYKITIRSRASDYFRNGTIQTNNEVDITGPFGASISGNFTLTGEGIMEMNENTEFIGTATIASGKIVQNLKSWYPSLTVKGDLINYGILRDNPASTYMYLYTQGNIYNYGQMSPRYCTIQTNGSDVEVRGNFNSDLTFRKTGNPEAGRIYINDYFSNQYYTTIYNGTELVIPENSYCEFLRNLTVNGSISNYGSMLSSYYYLYSSSNISFPSANEIGFRINDKGQADTVRIKTTNASYPSTSSSIKRYWSIGGTKPIGSYSVTLKYSDDILNGNSEEALEAYFTNDGGLNWKKISNPLNVTRDPANNTIKIGSDAMPITDGYGDIILSSGYVTDVTSISSVITGRKQVRVGTAPFFPPNRMTVTYWNNNNFTSDYLAMKLSTKSGVHIQSVISKKIGTDTLVTIPIDSLTYNGIKDEVILILQPMLPNEVRSFDVVLSAEGPLNKSMDFGISFATAILWVGGAALEEYIGNTVVAGCYEMWRPVGNDESTLSAMGKVVGNSIKSSVTVENGLAGVSKKAAEKVVKVSGRSVLWPAFLAKDIFDCMGNTIRGIQDYLNGNFDKQEKELQKVTSWDPNEKEGPTGYGAQGYMATSAPMTYTIFFENKKEAQAAAYRVQIVDTLDANVFDVNSVEFGPMSHSMGVASRNGNILNWDFVGIELQPNATPPEGEGWVKFTVKPKAALPTGTELKNSATITFDVNAPITTNKTLNTLDLEPPVTTLASATQVKGKDEVSLSWTVDDKSGSGLKKSLIYMATGDGPFSLVKVSETNSAIVEVPGNNSYKFYVTSEDNVGNAEKTVPTPIDVTTDIEDKETIPTEFYLYQNYPNPFNPSTTIKFKIPQNAHVVLKIYDILGQEIATLINEVRNAGNYSIDWRPDVSSGVYFYTLQAGEFVQSKKMLFLK